MRIHEGGGQPVVRLEVRIGTVVGSRVRTEFVVRRHVGREIPGSSQLEEIRMLQNEVLGPEARL